MTSGQGARRTIERLYVLSFVVKKKSLHRGAGERTLHVAVSHTALSSSQRHVYLHIWFLSEDHPSLRLHLPRGSSPGGRGESGQSLHPLQLPQPWAPGLPATHQGNLPW